MFLLWNLNYLAVASAIVWIFFNVATEAANRSMRKRLGWSIKGEIKKAIKGKD